MEQKYNAVLDVFALVSTYPQEANILRELTQAVALAYLRGEADPEELLVLLKLARDLGYTSDEMYTIHKSFI